MESTRRLLGKERLAASAVARCVAPLLVALDWFGAPDAFVGSLPSPELPMDVADLERLLAAVGFRVADLPTGDRDVAGLPAAGLVVDGDACHVHLGGCDGRFWWHDGESVVPAPDRIPAGARVFVVFPDYAYRPVDAPQPYWLTQALAGFGHVSGKVAAVSLLINVLALAVSLFTMTVYDHVIPGGAQTTLAALTAGTCLAILGAWILRLARTRTMTRLTAPRSLEIAVAAFRKTLGLPLEQIARIGPDAHIGRLRAADAARGFITGGAATDMIDYPFVIIFVAVIGLIGGAVVLAPLVGLAVMALAAIPVSRLARTRSEQSALAAAAARKEIAIAVRHGRALRCIGGLGHWMARITEVADHAALAARRQILARALGQSVAQTIAMVTALATLALGIDMVMSGAMTTGALIATMMLIWRVTTPAQRAFSAFEQIRRVRNSVAQLDRLMTTVGERPEPKAVETFALPTPTLAIERLYVRFSADQEPALAGVSLEAAAGSRLVVTGPNGAGKSVLARCLAGLCAAQAGNVRLDGRDIRQFDPITYRSGIGYLPQVPGAFLISLRDHLTLGHPGRSDAVIAEALSLVGGAEWWRLFAADNASHALKTIIDPSRRDRFARRARTTLALALAFIETPPLIILDDPVADRDPLLDAGLRRALDHVRGRSTVVLITHRPELVETADTVAVLDRGNLIHSGPMRAEGKANP